MDDNGQAEPHGIIAFIANHNRYHQWFDKRWHCLSSANHADFNASRSMNDNMDEIMITLNTLIPIIENMCAR